MCKVLITSGGTSVKIDAVRSITNMSTGRFGSEIAREFVDFGCDTVYVVSKNGKRPLLRPQDFGTDVYKEYVYDDYYEYKDQLYKAIVTERPDMVILAAAVSDYVVKNPSQEKISSDTNLTIELEPAPKIISGLKRDFPWIKLVGFKLLVDSSFSSLVKAAIKSIETNNCDMVVANDLTSIKNGKHEIVIVQKTDKDYDVYSYDSSQARRVFDHCFNILADEVELY
jgi:phosphopantothenate--cysteine ligase